MKQFSSIIKSFLPTVIGAFMLLLYMNLLGGQGAALALGIIGVIVAAYYLVSGILLALAPEGNIRVILQRGNVIVLPTFMFVYFLMVLIQTAQGLGPTGWVISIFSLVASIGFAIFVLFSWLAKSEPVNKVTNLMGVLFLLSLVLTLFFNIDGTPAAFGDIELPSTVMYVLYGVLLFTTNEKKA